MAPEYSNIFHKNAEYAIYWAFSMMQVLFGLLPEKGDIAASLPKPLLILNVGAITALELLKPLPPPDNKDVSYIFLTFRLDFIW